MTRKKKTVQILYKKLLALYPREFREQFGESMEQTFNDLCRERKQTAGRGLFGFVLWMFIETIIGIIREYIVLITEVNFMKRIFTNLGSAAIISFILVLPLMILELVNRRDLLGTFPIALFGFLWFLPTAFIVVLTPIMRNARAGKGVMASPVTVLFKVAFLIVIGWMLGSLMVDQIPCFMGVPNCD